MTGDKQEIFPIIDRPAPLMERVRNRLDDNGDSKLGEMLGREMAAVAQEEDVEIIQDVVANISASAVESIADEMDINESDVDKDEVVELVASTINVSEDDITSSVSVEVDEETLAGGEEGE